MVNSTWKKRVEALQNKKVLNDEEQEALNKMLASPDKENGELAKEVIGVKAEEKLVEGLNPEQAEAFTSILDFFRDPQEDAFVLKGYAGTGKTFLVKRILEYINLKYPNRKIAITAPTNKAVRVLQNSSAFDGAHSKGLVFENLFETSTKLTYATIHKLLGLKETITNSGQQLFKADRSSKVDITKFKYLIVDEVSMLDDELFREIQTHSDRLKILYMGDPAQIPPINKTDCIPFSTGHSYNFKEAELKEIMRQKGDHPIVDASFLLRNNLSQAMPIPKLETQLNEKGHGIVYMHSKEDRPKVKPMLKRFFDTDEFRANADYAKVIAWTNNTVNYMNTTIRELLYGADAERYVVGEKLVTKSPVFEKSQAKWGMQWNILFNTSEEMEVVAVKEVEKKFHEDGFNLKARVHQLKVKAWDAGNKEFYHQFIYVMHQDSISDWKAILKEAKDVAIARRKANYWVTYYNIMKWSADVVYNYAITCHKSQGSTYQNVLLLEEDIDRNRKTVERNRIKYTSYTRPTDKLFILRKNYA